jgi:hypothetical protein
MNFGFPLQPQFPFGPVPVRNDVRFPTGHLNLPPGVDAKINFYDPLTGEVHNSVTTRAAEVRPALYSIQRPQCQEKESNKKQIEELRKMIDSELSALIKEIISRPVNVTQETLDRQNKRLNDVKVLNQVLIELEKNAKNETSKYCGSGVLLFDYHQNVPSVILASNVMAGGGFPVYDDIGTVIPGIDHRILVQNAQEQLTNGSCQLFRLAGCNLENNEYMDLPFNGSRYRCYFVCAQGTSNYDISELFNQNRNLVQSSNTQDICRFTLRDLLNAAITQPQTGRLQIKNSNGTLCYVGEKTSNILRNLVRNPELLRRIFSKQYPANYNNFQNLNRIII